MAENRPSRPPRPFGARTHGAEPVSDRELARAIEHCVGREDLASALQRARNRIAAETREIEQTPTVPAAKQVSSPTGKRRGRPANVQETARRAAVLERVQKGEISNAEAATEIGIAYGTWAGWKAQHEKRAGVMPAPIARTSVEPTSITTGKRGRGRPVDPARLAMLERVLRGELGHATAAAELGMKRPAWMQWFAYHEKQAGGSASLEAPREIARASLESAGKGRGCRPFNVAENARRAALLARLDAGELTNAEAAAELGITVGAWSSWKTSHTKRAARPVTDDARASRDPNVVKRLARLDELERFGTELKQRLRDLLRLVNQALG
jgi:hypothetical protein